MRTPRHVTIASEHSGGDFALWLRYISKWVGPAGHEFSDSEVSQIMSDPSITPFQKAIFSQAITPGTPTNDYVIKLRQPQHTRVQEIERRLLAGEQVY